MNKTFTRSLLCAAGLALISGQASAQGVYQDVVRDERGIIVHNTFGNCVRTRWISAKDACGGQVIPAAVQTRKSAFISKDERTVYFDFDKSNLRNDAVQKLNTLSQTLRSDEQVKQARVVGYADRIGNNDYNEKLSRRRAESVRDYLVSKGVVTAQKTETRWYGETAPATNCSDSLTRPDLIDCLQKDRKVEVEIDYQPGAVPVAPPVNQ